MAFRELRDALRARLDEADRGDRAWWLLTRVHLTPARLQSIASYLNDAGAAKGLRLRNRHYSDLADILGIENANPRQTINRHYFLAMEMPLRLLSKLDGTSWDGIELSRDGVRLASEDSAVAVFERLLSEIRFCLEPWYTASRAAEYEAFDVRPYPATLEVLRASGGYIDIDEFDLFVSRIRHTDEVDAAIANVADFRELDDEEKGVLRAEVERRIPRGAGANPRKPYDNWRDMARHTFSLFSLGESANRVDNRLFLSSALALHHQAEENGERRPRDRQRQTQARRLTTRTATVLRIPGTMAPDDLLEPPTPPRANNGTDAELLVGKILTSDGWQVVYYSQRRGYGFDLWARKGDQAFLIEVKSFTGQGGAITLTPMEYEAARHHRDNFLLVVVEEATSSSPAIHVIQDPARVIRFTERTLAQHTAARSIWFPATTDVLGTARGR